MANGVRKLLLMFGGYLTFRVGYGYQRLPECSINRCEVCCKCVSPTFTIIYAVLYVCSYPFNPFVRSSIQSILMVPTTNNIVVYLCIELTFLQNIKLARVFGTKNMSLINYNIVRCLCLKMQVYSRA
ncbi:hypothetical protein R6Q59_011299 [Mikania micrantha]